MKHEYANPLKASESKPKQIELLWSLTEYLAEHGLDDNTKYPSSIIGYVLALKALWENQRPNGYGYMQEKFGEALTAYKFMMDANSQDDEKGFQYHKSLLYQSLYKIKSAISMFRNQREAWNSEDK